MQAGYKVLRSQICVCSPRCMRRDIVKMFRHVADYWFQRNVGNFVVPEEGSLLSLSAIIFCRVNFSN